MVYKYFHSKELYAKYSKIMTYTTNSGYEAM